MEWGETSNLAKTTAKGSTAPVISLQSFSPQNKKPFCRESRNAHCFVTS
jgi:hypothetical protein